MKIKKYFLIFASITVSAIALLYGVSPDGFAHTFLGIAQLDLNMAHILRAVMGLYLAAALAWLLAAFSDKYRNTGILTTIVFCSGLVLGRIVSLLADGQPAPVLLLYVAMEMALVPVAYWIYKLPD